MKKFEYCSIIATNILFGITTLFTILLGAGFISFLICNGSCYGSKRWAVFVPVYCLGLVVVWIFSNKVNYARRFLVCLLRRPLRRKIRNLGIEKFYLSIIITLTYLILIHFPVRSITDGEPFGYTIIMGMMAFFFIMGTDYLIKKIK